MYPDAGPSRATNGYSRDVPPPRQASGRYDLEYEERGNGYGRGHEVSYLIPVGGSYGRQEIPDSMTDLYDRADTTCRHRTDRSQLLLPGLDLLHALHSVHILTAHLEPAPHPQLVNHRNGIEIDRDPEQEVGKGKERG